MSDDRRRRVVVVGASLGGLRTVEQLRRRGYEGHVTLIGAEVHAPYDRPPLSKQVLRGQVDAEGLRLRTEHELGALDAELVLGTVAEQLDPSACEVHLDDGRHISYDCLVIATGASPRRLPGAMPPAGVHHLRTVDDALALRDDLAGARSVAVIGGGFIGCEVAAAARSRGLPVTIVEAGSAPLSAVLPAEVGSAVADLHRRHGVDIRCGTMVAGLEGEQRVEQVRLADGTSVLADVVVVGIGVQPVTDWLRTSGVALDDGVVCDPYCQATAAGVFAVGDVARWHNPLFDETMRVEHWTNAVDQAGAVAANVVAAVAAPGAGDLTAFAPVPYFWSDQYDTRLQFAGRARPGDAVRVVEQDASGRLVVLFGRGERLVGVLTMNAPRELVRYRVAIAQRLDWDSALDRVREAAS